MSILRKGDTGEDVLRWQGIIGVGESGVFDQDTEDATMAWQRHRGLEPDGVVGPKTWGAAGVVFREENVPVTRTVVSLRDYVQAVCRAWSHVDDGPATKGACAVLYAQYMTETGGAACWNWNIGNVKHVAGDGYDYHMLRGVWEGVSEVTAANLVASGHAVRDTNTDHQKAVAPNVSVVFQPPHPATWFRAFKNLDEAMVDHLKLLAKKRFSVAWPAVIAGDYRAFATLLKSRGYFTASADAYASAMRRPYEACMASSAFEDATGQDEIVTEPSPMPNEASDPTVYPKPLLSGEATEEFLGLPRKLSEDDSDPPPDAA